MALFRTAGDWLHERTGYRNGLHHLLDEPLPSSVNWWFTLGSVLLFLLVLQITTGAVLMMYYVPTPAYAYDSVKFIATQLAFGHLLRGLHLFGASFIVVAAGLHTLRVLVFGAYKSPREVTWWTGVILLLLIMAFALTGYLLPWDQRAYWATVVAINIAKSTPIGGSQIAAIMRGGPDIGALTLSRWFAAHVILLPAALVLFVVAHLYLMRRHGIAGHYRRATGPDRPFYPHHAIKDTVVVAAVFAALIAFAAWGHAPLEGVANPSDANYTPRPEWYFLSLFQLLKYFPGKLEPIAAHGIPGVAFLLLFLLPFLDRSPERHPARRKIVVAVTAFIVVGALTLTGLGLRDAPNNQKDQVWTPRSIAGLDLANSGQCTRCHTAGGAGPVLTSAKVTHTDDWIMGHVADPEVIAPGIRPLPPNAPNQLVQKAVVAYVAKLRAETPPPPLDARARLANDVFGTRCVSCHKIDGDGGSEGPDLTHAAKKAGRTEAWFKAWVADPSALDATADMPAFGGKLSDSELDAIAAWLAAKK